MRVSVHTVYKVQGQVPGTVGPSVCHVLVLLCVSFMASFKAVHQYIGHHIQEVRPDKSIRLFYTMT